MIAAEGKIIIIPVVVFALATTGFSVYSDINGNGLKAINIILWMFVMFCLYFFRDPVRIPQGNTNQMVSPADGKIVQILDIEDLDIGKATQISIFLSVFNVHCQRVPLKSRVLSSVYNPGKFLAAFNHKASMDNEQSAIIFEAISGDQYKVKQIAGLIARRILNYMAPEMEVEKGQRLGFIRFGSRVDIIVPPNFKINVSLGDIVKGNLSILGEFK